MSDAERSDDTEFEELDRLWDLAAEAVRLDDGKRSAHGWRRDSSSGLAEYDLERCRHGFTAGEYCESCDQRDVRPTAPTESP